MIAACGLLAVPNAAIAQSDEWFVGSHPDYHAAMVRDLDGIFVAEERLAEVRDVVQGFFDRSVESCPVADDFEARFFHRFDDAYLATDALLMEAGIFPLEEGVE